MKVEEEKESRLFDSPLVVGIVAHIPADRIRSLERAIESVEGSIVYRQVSENKLYLKEEDEDEKRNC